MSETDKHTNFLPAPKWCNTKAPYDEIFCDDEVKLEVNDPNYKSINQSLVGPPNPKTLIPPIIVPPIVEQEHWKQNDFVIRSGINSSSNQELYQSGYIIDDCCGPNPEIVNPPQENTCLCDYTAEETLPKQPPPLPKDDRPYYVSDYPGANRPNNTIIEGFEYPHNSQNGTIIEGFEYPPNSQNGKVTENFENLSNLQNDPKYKYPYKTTGECTEYCTQKSDCPCEGCKNKQTYHLTKGYPGQVMTSMGYNPNQLIEHNIPSNLAVGNCQKDDRYNSYNKNLFTQIIQPGVNTRQQIIEPINSNIGISFDQQFEPVTCEKDCNGNMTFVSHDPRIVPEKKPPAIDKFAGLIDTADIYDPRKTGYGTSYRSYIEPVTGQPRFYYDDVDAYRQYNYIVRSKIDFMDGADSAGPMSNVQARNNSSIREMANNKFTEDTINFRTDLQERLMRKINAEAWQQRAAPMHKTASKNYRRRS